MINGYDKYIKIKDTDTIVFAEPISDNIERSAVKAADAIAKIGANVIMFSSKEILLHHASSEDLMLMINLLNPKYYFPVKGEYRFQVANANVATEVGINKENILQFVKDWQEKQIKPYYKSEEIPFEQKGNVYTIVGKTFQRNVIDNDKDVLVKFYSPSCAHCKKLAPVYEELAKKYKSNSKLLIAEFDGTKNEAEDIHIKGYPTIKFWPAGKKKKPIDFSGERTLKNLEDFIKKHGTNPINIIENKEDLEKSDL
jgi:protein disulfide isomerase